MTNYDCSDSFVIPGYNLHMINRKHKAGGGICVFTKENLTVRLRNDINIISNNENIESLFIEIVSEKTKNIVIGTIYIPPHSNFNDFENNLKTILSNLGKCNKPCYIMGDFDIYLLKYDHCNFSNQFFKQFSSSGYMPLIIKPTRIMHSTAT